MPMKYKLELLDIFNAMYREGEFPQAWRHSFIHMVDKHDRSGVKPIALTPCMCKVFEALIKFRLEWWIEHKQLIPSSQSGFRKGRSCHDNLAQLTYLVDEALLQRNEVFATFLDVSDAFNNVLPDILLDRLAELDCSEKMIKFSRFLTFERYLHTNIEGYEKLTIHRGVPQGGVLSPWFYIIYTAECTKGLDKNNVTILSFADDIAALSISSPNSNSLSSLEKTSESIRLNLLKLGLDLSPKKTVFVHFNKKKILPGSTSIKIGGHLIQSSDYARFLGIHFDYEMTFTTHMNKILNKCNSLMNIIKFLCGTWWGADPGTLITCTKATYVLQSNMVVFSIFLTVKSILQNLNKCNIRQ